MIADWTDWRARVPDLSSEWIAYLALKAILDPRSMTPVEVQELAAAVLAHRSAHLPENRPPH